MGLRWLNHDLQYLATVRPFEFSGGEKHRNLP